MRDEFGLTKQQRCFADEYMSNGQNGTQAYFKNYKVKTERTAEAAASRLLSKVKVAAYIKKRIDEHSENTGITAEWILSSLQKIVLRSMQAVAVLDSQGNPNGEYRYDSSGANRALELLGKNKKMWTDKVEHEGLDSLSEAIHQAQQRARDQSEMKVH